MPHRPTPCLRSECCMNALVSRGGHHALQASSSGNGVVASSTEMPADKLLLSSFAGLQRAAASADNGGRATIYRRFTLQTPYSFMYLSSQQSVVLPTCTLRVLCRPTRNAACSYRECAFDLSSVSVEGDSSAAGIPHDRFNFLSGRGKPTAALSVAVCRLKPPGFGATHRLHLSQASSEVQANFSHAGRSWGSGHLKGSPPHIPAAERRSVGKWRIPSQV